MDTIGSPSSRDVDLSLRLSKKPIASSILSAQHKTKRAATVRGSSMCVETVGRIGPGKVV
jgi:hypothetical protein